MSKSLQMDVNNSFRWRYDSGYFDGVKLGGVRLDTDTICGEGNFRCARDNNGNLTKDVNGNYKYTGDKDYPTFQSILDSTQKSALEDKTKKSPFQGLFGPTGGFQPIVGGWYLPGGLTIPYKPGSISDTLVESFAGTHDFLRGQIWGWYGKDGNTSTNRTGFENKASGVTTGVAIPVSAPFALADLISPDVLQLIIGFGK
ncbi:hypothetical protein [Acinetobacter sp. KS-LM10]|uniref:hypothetical protein n=1 Tax=Acinetobacter sp. KS-LM10 TaxID=3120518 RepID=UPI0030CABCE9